MASVGVVRKLFLDSRFKVSGTDADFQIELPVDVDCTRTSSFFVASCSFANTYQTVTPFNQLFYFFVNNTTTGFKIIFAYPIPTGSYTPSTLAPQLQNAVNAAGVLTSTWTFDATIGNYNVTYSSTIGNQLFVPSYTEIDKFFNLLGASDGFEAPFVQYNPGSKYL